MSLPYEITDVVEPGQKNNVIVRVDATLNDGWFYEGAGIYQHVWLTSTDPLAVAPDGVFVYSRFPNNERVGAAEVWAEVSLCHDLGDDTLPFVAGQIHDVPLINDQIAHLPNEVPDTAFASAQGLVTQDRSHFNTESAMQLGERYAEAMLKLNKPKYHYEKVDPSDN